MVIQIQMAPELVKMDQKGPNFEFRSFFILFSKKKLSIEQYDILENYADEHSKNKNVNNNEDKNNNEDENNIDDFLNQYLNENLMELIQNDNDNGDNITDDLEKDTIEYVSNPINKIKTITKRSLGKKTFSKWTEEETIFGTFAYFKSYVKILKCTLVVNELKPEHQCADKIRRRIQDVDKKIEKKF